MQENKYLRTLSMRVSDIELLIQCDNCVLKYPHIGQLGEYNCEKKRADIIFNIYFDQSIPTSKYEEKLVWHEKSEAKLRTSWRLSRTNNLLLLRFDSPYPFQYSVLIDGERGIFDFYFEQKEHFMKNGLDISVFDLEYLLALYTLPKFDGILLHANVVDHYGKGLVFLGTSKIDINTLAELYQSQLAAYVFAKERVIIRKINGRFLLYEVPWQKGNVNLLNRPIEFDRIFFPQINLINYLSRKKRVDTCAFILNQSFHTFWDKINMEKTLNVIDKIACDIPCYNFQFVPDKTALKYLDLIEENTM